MKVVAIVPPKVAFVSPWMAVALAEHEQWRGATVAEHAETGYDAFFAGLPVKVVREWNEVPS